MRKIFLKGTQMQNTADAHTYLKTALSLPEYYGENADALFDCLTEIGTETELVLLHGDDADALILTVMRAAAKENPLLSLKETGTYGI